MRDFKIHNGDCAEVMASMEESSVDAIVTDAPYNLSFMQSEWDTFRKTESGKSSMSGIAFQQAMTPIFTEALRVTKPGAHLLCFGGTRTFHRMACAIEDAGWMLKDTIMWVHSQGFPKGLNVGKAFERDGRDELAGKWDGWHTQLKPAWEPILVAQKPLDGTVAHNVMTHGTGAINVDACRIPTEPHDSSRDGEVTAGKTYEDAGSTNFHVKPGPRGGDERGRFPANFVHDGSDEVLALFPESRGQQGDVTGNEPSHPADGVCYGEYNGRHEFSKRGDSGSAARFYYCAKASKKDRNRGGVENDHVSVKPNDLMRWLVRLVCPQGGIVLDPFMGSGSTGVACMDEGMGFIGIDMDEHYCEIAEARISAAVADNAQQSLF